MDFDSIINCKNCGSPEGFDCTYCGPKKPIKKRVSKTNKWSEGFIVFLLVFPLSIPFVLIIRRILKEREQNSKLETQISEQGKKLNHIEKRIKTLKKQIA